MSSLNTMLLIAETFVALTDDAAPEKISVSDIVTASGKNRKTFYYHFIDKNYLITWIFRYDLGKLLEKRFDKNQLVYEEKAAEPLAKLPYYVFVKSGVRSLDSSDFFKTLAECFQRRRPYYAKVLRDNAPNGLRDYLRQLYTPALRSDVQFILSNRYLKDTSIDFLAEFYAGAFLSYFINQTCDLAKTDLLEGVGPFTNIVHSSLENEIKEQQLRRML